MADEITVTVSLSFTKGGKTSSMSSTAQTYDMAGVDYAQGTQSIATAETQITLPADIGTAGWCFFKNTDTTDFVEIRPGTGTANCVKLKA